MTVTYCEWWILRYLYKGVTGHCDSVCNNIEETAEKQ